MRGSKRATKNHPAFFSRNIFLRFLVALWDDQDFAPIEYHPFGLRFFCPGRILPPGQAPAFGARKTAILQDIALATGWPQPVAGDGAHEDMGRIRCSIVVSSFPEKICLVKTWATRWFGLG